VALGALLRWICKRGLLASVTVGMVDTSRCTATLSACAAVCRSRMRATCSERRIIDVFQRGGTQLSPGDISPRPSRKRRIPRAPASARRQTSSARPAGPRARVDDNFKRAAGAAKRHNVGSAPLVGLWQPEHCRRRRHGDSRWRAHCPGRRRLWRCVLMRSVCESRDVSRTAVGLVYVQFLVSDTERAGKGPLYGTPNCAPLVWERLDC
jgi:hypothetical protein